MRNVEQQEFWDALAPDWIGAQKDLEGVGGWFGDRAMESLQVAAGEEVVDIGCGTGETTVALARAAGAAGRAIGVDISSVMIEEARRRAERVEDANVTYIVADVEEAAVAEGADAAYSRFGVMFFADPARAFANVRASLRSGGRFAAVAWQQVFSNEWMLLPGLATLTATGGLPHMPGDDEPGPFSLQDADRFRALLEGAGFVEVEVLPLQHEVIVERVGVDTFVQQSMAVGAAREAVREKGDDPAVAAAIAQQLRQDLLDRIGDDTATRLSAAAWLAVATAG
jgi:SAM-dependent methyltransferase